MPNWASNKLSVRGTAKRLKPFAETLNGKNFFDKEEPFCFHQTVPVPDDVYKGEYNEKLDCYLIGSDAPAHNILNWQRENWGVKWDVSDAVIEDEDTVTYLVEEDFEDNDEICEIIIRFNTPWGPPADWLRNVSEKYPDLEFSLAWSEAGMGGYGILTAVEGGIDEECWTTTDDDYEMDEDGEFVDYVGDFGHFLATHEIDCGG